MKKTLLGFGIGLGTGIIYMNAVCPSPTAIQQMTSYTTIQEYYSSERKVDTPFGGSADSSYLTIKKHFNDKGYRLILDYKGKETPLYDIHDRLVAGNAIKNLEGALRHAQPGLDRLKTLIDSSIEKIREKTNK